MEESMNALGDTLHASGRRMTSQRRTVLEILESSDTHLHAEGIWERAQSRGEKINLATVYRTLSVLNEMGLVNQRYFARNHKREEYESSKKPEHFHFTCLSCGDVIEFSTSFMNAMRAELEKEKSVQLTHTCLCFEGYCSSCKENSSMQMERT